MGREGKSKPICPRCGQPYSYIEARKVGNNVYYYAVHYHREGGKRKVRKCYLGPERYEYVTKHEREGLRFRGMITTNSLSYLDALINYISSPEFNLTPDVALKLADRLERLAGRLREGPMEEEGEEEGSRLKEELIELLKELRDAIKGEGRRETSEP